MERQVRHESYIHDQFRYIHDRFDRVFEGQQRMATIHRRSMDYIHDELVRHQGEEQLQEWTCDYSFFQPPWPPRGPPPPSDE